MRRQVVCSTDLCDTSVSRHDDDGGLVALKSSIKEREAFNVEHVNLINEKHTRYNFGAAFFSPFGNLLVNLFSNFRLDLTDITSEKSHETLGTGVDNIDLVKSDGMDNLLSLLEFTLRALDKAGLGTNIIEITAAGKRATELGDFATSFIDCDDVASNDFLLGDGFDHLGTKIIDRLHFCCLEGDLTSLCTASNGLVNFNLDDFTFDNLGFFSDSHT